MPRSNRTSIGVDSMLLAVTLWMTRGYNEAGFEQAMANAWRPQRGLIFRTVADNLFVVQFFHPMDVQHVIDDGPWHFMRHIVIVRQVGGGTILVPLRRGIFFMTDDNPDDVIWLEFQYERLPDFCYYCGFLDHTERDCLEAFAAGIGQIIPREYGESLRARMPRTQMPPRNALRWMRTIEGQAIAPPVHFRPLPPPPGFENFNQPVERRKGSQARNHGDLNPHALGQHLPSGPGPSNIAPPFIQSPNIEQFFHSQNQQTTAPEFLERFRPLNQEETANEPYPSHTHPGHVASFPNLRHIERPDEQFRRIPTENYLLNTSTQTYSRMNRGRNPTTGENSNQCPGRDKGKRKMYEEDEGEPTRAMKQRGIILESDSGDEASD